MLFCIPFNCFLGIYFSARRQPHFRRGCSAALSEVPHKVRPRKFSTFFFFFFLLLRPTSTTRSLSPANRQDGESCFHRKWMTFFLSGSVKRPTAFVFTFHWRGDGSLQDASETGFSEAQIADSVCVKTVALRKAPEEQPLLQVSSLLKKIFIS